MIAFENVTATAGMTYAGQSWGGSWGDYNNDGLPDLWVGNHTSGATLYRNNGDGSFTDVIVPTGLFIDPTFLEGDTHGAMWADFDNDGDQDFVQTTGASPQGNNLFVNNGGVFTDQATALGVQGGLNRGRNPHWIDINRDGLLDLYINNRLAANGTLPPVAYLQQPGGTFVDSNAALGVPLNKTTLFSNLTDLTGDGQPDLIAWGDTNPVIAYDISGPSFVQITSTLGLGNTPSVKDSAVADFNGDLKPDIFLARAGQKAGVVQTDPNTLMASLLGRSNSEQGLDFATAGDVTFGLGIPFRWNPSEVFIGSTGSNPLALDFTLSSTDANNFGIFPHNPGDKGVYVGYDTTISQWQIRVSAPATTLLTATIAGVDPITAFTRFGFDVNAAGVTDRLFSSSPGGLVNDGAIKGLGDLTAAYGVAAGDFDNDMDVDLYVVLADPTFNLPNVIYENQGDGTFVKVTLAGGAEGSSLGRGDNVALADFDRDGFLDVFLTNGEGDAPFNAGGPHELFRNLGNGNHWIEIDLEGTASNRDAIGARVLLTAGGVTQLREHDNGTHNRAQNYKEIHFGLAGNQVIDQIQIIWPSGFVQELVNVQADQLLHLLEPASLLVGDLNGDGFVGIDDLNIVLGSWNQAVTPGDWLVGDPSGDGFVGLNDLNAVLGNWNAQAPPTSAGATVPEPGMLAMFVMTGLAMIRRRSPRSPRFPRPTCWPTIGSAG